MIECTIKFDVFRISCVDFFEIVYPIEFCISACDVTVSLHVYIYIYIYIYVYSYVLYIGQSKDGGGALL